MFKALYGGAVPRSLFELQEYFRLYGTIIFENKEGDDGIVAISTNFQYGSIITKRKTVSELEKNIKDAILTAFSVSSAYSKEAKIQKTQGLDKKQEYALA